MPKHALSTSPSEQPTSLVDGFVLTGVRFYALCFFAERGDTGTLADLHAELNLHSGNEHALSSIYTLIWRFETTGLIIKIGEQRTRVSRGTGQNLYRVTPEGRRLLGQTKQHCERLANHVARVLT